MSLQSCSKSLRDSLIAKKLYVYAAQGKGPRRLRQLAYQTALGLMSMNLLPPYNRGCEKAMDSQEVRKAIANGTSWRARTKRATLMGAQQAAKAVKRKGKTRKAPGKRANAP
jgi:hypothetical protein